MTQAIPVQLAVEDELSETVLRRLLKASGRRWAVGACYRNHGFGYLKSAIAGFNRAARGVPFLVLTDLDKANCAPGLISDWLRVPRHANLIFRVAVREVEAWLLADGEALAAFLKVDERRVPEAPEGLPDPKAILVGLARMSSSREIREDIAPAQGATAVQGPNYTSMLGRYVARDWRPRQAAARADSLRRALRRLRAFRPAWPGV